jgi:hypothetical protein
LVGQDGIVEEIHESVTIIVGRANELATLGEDSVA